MGSGNNESDPWCSSIPNSVGIGSLCERFEDDFTDFRNSEKLHDSAEYIASLEKKLAKIKGGKGVSGKKSEENALLKGLEEKSNSCMFRLISGDSYSLTEQDVQLDTPINSKWLPQVVPERALTVGELVALVKADYLAHNSVETHEEQEETSG